LEATTYTASDVAPAEVARALADAGFEVGRDQKVRRTLLDSYDGRLHAGGMRLELRDPGHQLILTGRAPPSARVVTTGIPRVARDLPSGPFRQRVAAALGVRALLPALTLTAWETTATKRDRDGKARVSVILHDQVTVEDREGAASLWAEVSPTAGYDKDAAGAREVLGALGLRPHEGDVLEAAAAQVGIRLCGSATSASVPLDPEEPALDSFRWVLANLATTVEANWEGTVNDVDPEFLHDLRVAVRRTRSVLAEGKQVLPPDVRDDYRAGFRWLGTATGRPRDLDVYVIEWDGYVAPLGPDAAALAPVLALLQQQRREQHTALAQALQSRRYRALMTGWQTWLRSAAREGAGRHADRPVGVVVARRTARAQDCVLARGRSITPATPAEGLHELRKDAKKLRYLLECFGTLHPQQPLKAFVRRLKALQENLGEHQDAEVHVNVLRAMSSELHDAAGALPETLLAMGRLAEHLERRRTTARRQFAERFAAYDTKQARRHLEDLLDALRRRA
jgi:CHAD domain-containing protein